MSKIRTSDIDWPKWWPGHGLVALVWALFCTDLLLESVGVLPSPGSLLRRLDALEDRPACTCAHTEPVPAADPGVGLVPPMHDERVVWERWVRADGRASK